MRKNGVWIDVLIVAIGLVVLGAIAWLGVTNFWLLIKILVVSYLATIGFITVAHVLFTLLKRY